MAPKESKQASSSAARLLEPHVVVRIRPLAKEGGHSAAGKRVYKRLATWSSNEVVLDDNVDGLGESEKEKAKDDPKANPGGSSRGNVLATSSTAPGTSSLTAAPMPAAGGDSLSLSESLRKSPPATRKIKNIGGVGVVGPSAAEVAATTRTDETESNPADGVLQQGSTGAASGMRSSSDPGGSFCRPQSYRFMNEVLPPEASQEQVYSAAAAGLVRRFTQENYNGLLFAYGQTGTGKTHTIFGPSHAWDDMRHPDAGIFPRAVIEIFESLAESSTLGSNDTGKSKFLLTASAMEFYMCQCTDLLDNSAPCLINGDDHLPIGLVGVELHHPDDALAFMATVRTNRTARETLMNKADKSGHAGSSRSHCALILTLRQVLVIQQEGASKSDQHEVCLKKHLHILDMAGAERPSSTGTENEIAIKAIMAYFRGAEITIGGQGFIVNYELSGLRTAVVQATEQHKRRRPLVIIKSMGTSFIEYASGCFTGSNLLAMIVTLSPAPSCGWETWFSCTYGEDLRKLRCPVVPQRPAAGPGRSALEALVRECGGKAAAARAELDRTPKGGPGAKYLFRRSILARHAVREAELWGKLTASKCCG